MKVYFISGLGADERVFRHIQLPPGYEAVHLSWIPPQEKESLHEYALRLGQKISRDEPFALVGLSLGGMMAIELAKTLQPQKTILISSIPVASAMPPYYKFAGLLRLHRIVPVSMIKRLSWIKRLFTSETSEDKAMLRMMIRDVDPKFVRWAFAAALGWKNEELPKEVYQIHGSADAILPARYTQPRYLIRGAGHLMILNRAKKINEILKEILT